MVLLVDTNILMDFLTKREPFYEAADAVLEKCNQSNVRGYMAFHTVSNLWYLLRHRPETERRNFLLQICRVLSVTGASHDEVIRAIQSRTFRDLEDCLQERCAVQVHADYIITRNLADFRNSEIPALSPQDFLSL